MQKRYSEAKIYIDQALQNMGEDAPGNEDLLSTVKHLLGTLLGGNFSASLLDLLGVGKSYISYGRNGLQQQSCNRSFRHT